MPRRKVPLCFWCSLDPIPPGWLYTCGERCDLMARISGWDGAFAAWWEMGEGRHDDREG